MKVVIVNKYDKSGGAAIAAYRLFEALKANEIDAKYLVQEKKTNEKDIFSTSNNKIKKISNFFKFSFERLVVSLKISYQKYRFAFSIANVGENISKNKLIREADIIHLHWINFGFLSVKSLKNLLSLNKPIVWTLHDMWAFTGGCHYSFDCINYKTKCQNCFYLKNQNNNDLSTKIFNHKLNLFLNSNINFITCSNWLKNEAKSSYLLKSKNVIHINNPINTDFYNKKNKTLTRQKFNISAEKKVILFGAMNLKDERKGLKYLIDALDILTKKFKKNELLILLFGKSNDEINSALPFDFININYTNSEEQIVNIYNCADVYVIPSLQDNLPNTIVEAHSCGIPVVGFNVAGISEMIIHKKTGYLAELKSEVDLANGIEFILKSTDYEIISDTCRKYALNNYSYNNISQKFIEIYKKILNQKL